VTSERVQARIARLLDEAEDAADQFDWKTVLQRAKGILAFDPNNVDAQQFQAAAERALAGGPDPETSPQPSSTPPASGPTSFAAGRYEVRRFLGEGGKKRVYLAHDAQLDRDVAFALIKTEGLDDAARQRITREAQAMGRLGSHPHIVTVYDIGEENGQPYLVLPVLPGGDVEGVIEDAPEHKLPIEQAVKIAIETCLGLEFSHAKGIIHRDLKPGNVWLAEDGRAMIGDFGLAVAVDRSRLTQAGMMVGTVNYMPPEQAMGGEISPRSDLYSLGAMLYEMVCGRPPFVGDESVAIIGQHLNTPPVAPTWHRPDCPPGLEALILRLLEKDASKRPASATEVREALQSVGASSVPAATHDEAAAPHEHNPLYRRTFVGREQELKQLQQTFDASMSGQGGLVMVVGEPGIGKTSVVEQLATYVQLRGGMTLMGHCYEEGSLSLPYLPFIEAMRSYVLAREPDGLRSDLGSGASEVARIVSEVRDKVNVSPSEGGDPEEQRWRLMEAVRGFLHNASEVQPLMVVLEDLHDSDRGTLDLLVHLARSLEGARLLIVGTYRDVEVDRAHPLSGALAELRRGLTFTRVPLRGLTIDEVHRLYSAVRGHVVSWAQSEAVHRQTEGNPLFIQEFLRYLVEEGLVVRQDGRYQPVEGQGPGSNIPEGLRDVIGKRLSLLSEKTNQVLCIAAVIGRDFRLDALQRVADLSEDEVIDALEQATERAVVEVRSKVAANLSYRFTHAFFRQTLYEELSPPRRIRLHQQVARALEQIYGARVEDHAAELAEHYSYSSDPVDLTKAVEYGERAAARAMAVYAFGEAVDHLTRALEVQAVLNPDDGSKLCSLLLALGDALNSSGDFEQVASKIAPEAFSLAESLGDSGLLSKSCLLGLETIWLQAGRVGAGISASIGREWIPRADRHIPRGTKEQVRADFHKVFGLRAGGRTGEAWRLALDDYELAERLDDDEARLLAGIHILNASETPVDEYHRVIAVAERLSTTDTKDLRAADATTYYALAPQAFLATGRRKEAEELWGRLRTIAEQRREPQAAEMLAEVDGLLLTLDGRFDEALDLRDTASFGQGRLGRIGRRSLVYLGRFQEALDSIATTDDIVSGSGILSSQRAYALGFVGRVSEAHEILRAFLAKIEAGEHVSATVHRYLLEAAVSSGHRDACSLLLERMHPLAPYLFTEILMCFCIARHLGDAAALLGRADDARSYYVQAREVCEKARFRPELALSRLGLAEVILDHYPDEHDAAIEHLDFAIAEFQDMKMQPALERALGRRGLLKA